jgi:hypothetical protein
MDFRSVSNPQDGDIQDGDPQDGDIEDIEACAREGRRPRDAGPYRILIGDALLSFQEFVLHEPVPTGRSLRELAALHPAEHHVCFAVLAGGLLEEVRPEESVDIRGGVEKFLAFRSDRIFRLFVDGAELQWGGPFITGATLLKLVGLDPDTHSLTLRHPEGERPIDRATLVDLAEPGVEDFVTAPLGPTAAA